MARPPVSSESVERALKNAMRNKWIDRWQRHPEGGHIVCIRKIGPVRFLNNQETNAFVLGLAAVDRNRFPPGRLSSEDAAKLIYEFTASVHAAMDVERIDPEEIAKDRTQIFRSLLTVPDFGAMKPEDSLPLVGELMTAWQEAGKPEDIKRFTAQWWAGRESK